MQIDADRIKGVIYILSEFLYNLLLVIFSSNFTTSNFSQNLVSWSLKTPNQILNGYFLKMTFKLFKNGSEIK